MKGFFVVLPLIAALGCAPMKFSAGMLTQGIIHQGGHYAGAKITGVELTWVDGFKSIPGFQPNEHMFHTEPEPLAYGGSLILSGLLSELALRHMDFEDEDGDKWYTDFLLGYLMMDSWDKINYGSRRSGLFGDHSGKGQNDLSEENFGKHHKAAGAASLFWGSSIAYRLREHKRVQKWYHNVRLRITTRYMGLTYVFD